MAPFVAINSKELMSKQPIEPIEQSDEPPPKGAMCVHCHSSISPGAPRCAECGGYQNWRRHLTLSATVLSLLVALISVSGLAIPLILDAVRGNQSILRANLSFGNKDIVYFHFTNEGGAPGLVESLAFVVGRYRVDFEIDQLGQDSDERLLRANEGGVLRIHSRQLNSNGLRIEMPSDVGEAYMDELAQWSWWKMDEENAFQEIARGAF